MPRAIIANTGMGATVAMVAAPTVIHCAGVGLIGEVAAWYPSP